MPELLRLHTPDFELSVWANDITKQTEGYQSTLNKRGIEAPQHVLRFNPPLAEGVFWVSTPPLSLEKGDAEKVTLKEASHVLLTQPLFFENTLYQFEWVFLQPVSHAYLTHRSRAINEAFRFVPKRGDTPARLMGTIQTANDVGWLSLPLCYELKGQAQTQSLAFEVLPIKMALHQDLPAMYETIDQSFPLWRFSLIQKTAQEAQRGRLQGSFPLMWLANFTALRQRFEQGLKVICVAPHNRLVSFTTSTKAARLKGRLSPKLSERVLLDLANGLHERHYAVEQKRLSVNTPENRFIKMVVTQSKNQLAKFEAKLRSHNEAPQNQRFSQAFLSELHAWQQPLQKLLRQSFLTEVGSYTGSNRESLVLQQKTGYSAVYRVWQELKFYLDALGGLSTISMKSVAEIYEIWCFLEIKQLLEYELGFSIILSQMAKLSLNSLFEYQLEDGFAGAFEFERADGVKARLVHEPVFSKQSKPIRSYLVNQKPDIVLEVTLPPTGLQEAKQFIWLFDAKYRMEEGRKSPNSSKVDLAPEDALNQMHRYRDALIHLETDKSKQKSRPIFGAFVLYPGFFDQEASENPYQADIAEVGIGAFALLPSLQKNEAGSDKHTGRLWLARFLDEQMGRKKDGGLYESPEIAERIYVQEAARIPAYGMKQSLYPDLLMMAALGKEEDRDPAYFDKFRQGLAQWYHMPKKTFNDRFKHGVVTEIRYLGLAFAENKNSDDKQITKVWPVKQVKLVARHEINVLQSGKESTHDELYYLFKLGKPLALSQPICNVTVSPMTSSMILTTLSRIENVSCFSKVETVYIGADYASL